MAGHSQFKNIMHRKGAQDKKRAKVFTKIIRELTVAAKNGSDPNANPRLRTAVLTARAANMPKDTMERAIKRGSDPTDTTTYEAIRYEGYGPQGTAFIVETLTDNRNRTAPEIRALFNKSGGSLGEPGSVSFMFEHLGRFVYPLTCDETALLDVALGHGGLDLTTEKKGFVITCRKDSFADLRDSLHNQFNDPLEEGIVWKPQTQITVTDQQQEAVLKLIDTLEDHDDVQAVWNNVQMS
jgi:YebC/PmpR family DNA-binding regulatory protein